MLPGICEQELDRLQSSGCKAPSDQGRRMRMARLSRHVSGLRRRCLPERAVEYISVRWQELEQLSVARNTRQSTAPIRLTDRRPKTSPHWLGLVFGCSVSSKGAVVVLGGTNCSAHDRRSLREVGRG